MLKAAWRGFPNRKAPVVLARRGFFAKDDFLSCLFNSYDPYFK